MRIGGVFPFGEPASVIDLSPGSAALINPGNYLVVTGRVSVLQYWDNVNNLWRGLAGPGQTIPISCDGTNYRLINFSGVVTGCSFAAGGSGATNGIGSAITGVTVSFGAAPTNGRAASAYPIVGGSINTTLNIVQAGSGFLALPRLVSSQPPTGGIRATARVTSLTASGGINAVTVDNPGAGYQTAPTWTIQAEPQFYTGAPSGGAPAGAYPYPGLIGGTSGAVITSNPTLTNSGALTGLVVTDYGMGYTGTTIPTVTLGGTLASGPTITPIMAFSMTGNGAITGGAGYTGTAPFFETSLGLVAATDGNNGVYLPRPARGVATLTTGAVSALIIEDPGFAMQKVPSLAIVNVGSIATTQATAAATVGGIQDTCLIQPAVNE